MTKTSAKDCTSETGLRDPNERLHDKESTQLIQTIEGEIIPRLMMVHGLVRRPDDSGKTRCQPPSEEDVRELARLLMLHGLDTGRAFVRTLQAEGLSLEQLFIDLMAPVARLYGELWADDRCSFAEVTLGLSQLQGLVRELAGRFDSEFEFIAGGRSVLLALAPGEQHTFGLQMVEECLSRAGWTPTRVQADGVLIERLRSEWTAAIGFTASSEDNLPALQQYIAELKAASLNPDLIVMVGGSCFDPRSERAYEIGATVALSDARSAVLFLQHALLRS